ncbi:hypothetical protein SSABA_v1c06100 [Spiroplasma sabaudiense Ar-1343]|uniref:Uncharacterized protein n=1 Tax=Spiroplasma sabaudiense Ar-1343 TaxID=1276257 RepID=W6AJV8_9MOLU|nr:hypothetical protein SSABA_v1c06100 [Spiroplasma sabaudiense Ar-1343]
MLLNFLDYYDAIVEKYMQKVVKINYNKYQFKWPYEDYFRIFNLPNLITFLERELNYKFGNLLIEEIENKLETIRKLVKEGYDFSVRIIYEFNNFEDQLKQYKEYLIFSYSKIKNFISLVLIKWIFHNIIHEDVYINGQNLDIDKYYDLELLKLKNNLILNKIKLTKILLKTNIIDSELNRIIIEKNQEVSINNKAVQVLKETK